MARQFMVRISGQLNFFIHFLDIGYFLSMAPDFSPVIKDIRKNGALAPKLSEPIEL